MARTGDHVRTSVKRALWLQSHGLCQYIDCDEELLTVDPITGAFTERGIFAHILPIKNSARNEYKSDFPEIDLNGPANLIYLCPKHHNYVDKVDIARHPPSVLFAMKARKSNFLGDGISTLLHIHAPLELNLTNFLDEYAVSGILDGLRQARDLGPLKGRNALAAACKAADVLLKNPFVKESAETRAIVESQCALTSLYIHYKAEAWYAASTVIKSTLRIKLSHSTVYTICSSAIMLIRDEYNMFNKLERLNIISTIVNKLDGLPRDTGLPFAFRLLLKSALLRWRGRQERGHNQRNTYAEAKRSAGKAYEISRDPGCLLQTALIAYSNALCFQYNEYPAHETYIHEAFATIERQEVSILAAATHYKARLYRDTYRYADSVAAFWASSSSRPSEAMRTAYLLAEAVVGQHYYDDTSSTESLSDALNFVRGAIGNGYDHGRNIAGYISCRAIIEPLWFRGQVIDVLFCGSGSVDWTSTLDRMRKMVASPRTDSEVTFGIEEAEFWNTIAEAAAKTLNDSVLSMRCFGMAYRHAEATGGKLRARLGLARQYYSLNDRDNFNFYIEQAKEVCRSYQASFIHELAKTVKDVGFVKREASS